MQAIAPPRTSRRVPELDGLRGIAILLVLENHYRVLATPLEAAGLGQLKPLLFLGWSGVDLFFVLSGFLLGGILMDHKGASNYFRVFYTRRVCRIFPLYFVVVAVLLLVPLPVPGALYAEPLPSWTYLTFTQNFAFVHEHSLGTIWLLPTWSIAVEEQFYVLLPFLILLVSRSKLPWLVVGLILACALSRKALVHDATGPEVAAATLLLPFRADALLLGILVAWAMRNARWRGFLSRARVFLYALLLLLVVTVAVLALQNYDDALGGQTSLLPPLYGYALLALLYACAVLLAVSERRGPVSAITRNAVLGKLGIISYGMYLLHVPVTGLSYLALGDDHERAVLYLIGVGALVLTVGLATASWRFFERRIVDWGRSSHYSPTRP